MTPKTPLIIVVVLLLVAASAIAYVLTASASALTAVDRLNATIAILACLGAFVSATFVIYSYLQTNAAFVESQRPQLLMQVETIPVNRSQESEEVVPMTRIHYKNITTNAFRDLTIGVTVTAENRSIDLSDVFRPKMVMIGLDSRQRNFAHTDMLSSRGIDIEEIAQKGNEVLLQLSYTYTFQGKEDTVEAQQYRWDRNRREWAIT